MNVVVCIIAVLEFTTQPNNNGSITKAEGSVVVMKCEATSDSELNYQWRRMSKSLPSRATMSDGNKILTIRNTKFSDMGQYYCEVDNGGGSVSSMSVQVVIKSKLSNLSVIYIV